MTFENADFVEVWLHEGCAVWSPSIYTKNNRLFGIATAVKTSLDMVGEKIRVLSKFKLDIGFVFLT